MEILKIIGIFLLLNVLLYFVGSFITFNMDPTNWWLIKTTMGRVFFLVIELGLFGAALEILEIYDNY
jgi:hypothetical protein